MYGEIGTPEIPFIRRHWSSTGRSDSSAGGGDDRKLAASAGQNWSMITPCGIYMNPSRTGGLYVLPWAVEPMTSNRGKASEAPSPFRQVRRSIITPFIMGRPLFPDSAMREWVTGHNRADERLHAVPIRGDILHQSIDHGFVITCQPSA